MKNRVGCDEKWREAGRRGGMHGRETFQQCLCLVCLLATPDSFGPSRGNAEKARALSWHRLNLFRPPTRITRAPVEAQECELFFY